MKSNNGAMRDVSKADLEQMYFEQKMSQWDIAAKLKVTQGAIFYWMKKYGIKARSHDDSLILFGKSGRFTGSKNPKWNGGRYSQHGYIFIRAPKHPEADYRGYVREHRMVWHDARGPIPKGWHVHHKNGDKSDN